MTELATPIYGSGEDRPAPLRHEEESTWHKVELTDRNLDVVCRIARKALDATHAEGRSFIDLSLMSGVFGNVTAEGVGVNIVAEPLTQELTDHFDTIYGPGRNVILPLD